MDDFWLRVLISFFVGGVWLMSVSVIAEKFGSRAGGIIGGLPSTVLIALFFIGLNQGPDFAASATIVTPVAFIVNGYFLLLLALNATRGYVKSLALSSIFWIVAMAILVAVHLDSYPLSLAIWLIGLCILALIVKRSISLHNEKLPPLQFTSKQLIGRSLFAGVVIASAVVISKYSGPIVGGIFAAFPAMFLSTFTILYFARGPNFARITAAPMLLSASINAVIYSVAVYYFYPRVGIYTGTLLAYLVSLASAYFIVRNLIAFLHVANSDTPEII